MQYVRNIAFTSLIKVNGRLREFNFRKKVSTGNPIYDVDVSDERGDRHYFLMVKIDGRWMIGELNIPVWIAEVADHIHAAIEEKAAIEYR